MPSPAWRIVPAGRAGADPRPREPFSVAQEGDQELGIANAVEEPAMHADALDTPRWHQPEQELIAARTGLHFAWSWRADLRRALAEAAT